MNLPLGFVKQYVKLIKVETKMKSHKPEGKDYLTKFLRISPLSHALWRSCEALAFQEVEFKNPVLDIGCGFGEFAGVAFNKIEIGIDINNKDLQQAILGKKYQKLINADARKLPFKDSSFSTVISVSVLEHIPKVEKVISETHRVLKKGGLFIFSVPTLSMYNHLLIPKICNLFGLEKFGKYYFKIHCQIFKHLSLKKSNWWVKQLDTAGFEIIKKQGTVSPTLLKLHEVFLISAFPSQLYKVFFGRRLLISSGLRSKILPKFFSGFVYPDLDSHINMFFVARKK